MREELEKQQDEQQDEVDKIARLERQAQQRAGTITSTLNTQLEFLGKLDPDSRAALNDYDTYRATRDWLAKYAGSKSTDGSHPEIISIASRYLGVPYVWGGESPSGFDCSGFTMYCYEQIGVHLTHFARSQYDEGVHIAYEALMPGDLVFFGPSVEGIHHVGIYVGDGKYIQAPRTGDVVKVSSLSNRSDYVGACRPQR